MHSSRPRVTLRDIANAFGVSHATVSLALRNHPRISAALRKKIHAKAQELGYAPDPVLSALCHYRSNRKETPVQSPIAWLNCWPNPKELRNHQEFDAYWRGAAECANKFGYYLEEFVVGNDLSMQRLEKILVTRSFKGIIIPPHKGNTSLTNFNFENFSVVRLGRSVKSPASYVVTADQCANTILAFAKMREKGYKRIGFVVDDSPAQLFSAGFLHAQLKLPVFERIPICMMPVKVPAEVAQAQLVSWIVDYRPDVLIIQDARVPSLLTKAGYRVPQDIALAGTSRADCHISAGMDQNSLEVGRVAMLTLISLIHDFAQGIPPIFRQILVEGQWMDGPECPDFKPA